MDFLKKHYEKILLGVMLLGLIGVLVFMLFYIGSEKERMQQTSESYINPHPHELPGLDMTPFDSASARAKTPYRLDFETANKLFNPEDWQRALDNTLLKVATKIGPQVVVVTNISPLYFVVSLDSVITNELGVRYLIKAEHEAAPIPARRRPVPYYCSAGEKGNADFELLSVKGPPEAPDGLQLKLADTGEIVTIAKDKSYRRVDGYTADFRYDPEKKAFKARRAGDRVSFGGADYSVVEVNEHEVILQDLSNEKKTSLPFGP